MDRLLTQEEYDAIDPVDDSDVPEHMCTLCGKKHKGYCACHSTRLFHVPDQDMVIAAQDKKTLSAILGKIRTMGREFQDGRYYISRDELIKELEAEK